jgi:NAD(P)-dependent dehydrogenase (short-subunit alcohol dehydrogenase family)
MKPIKTNFGFHSTAEEVIEGVDLTGKRAVVTGAASGIGVETARALLSAGAQVTLAVRNAEAGHRVARELAASTGNDGVFVAPLELTDRRSIDAFVQNWQGPLHILVHNAGVMALPDLQRSPEGWEMQLLTNYLGPFAMSVGLHGDLTQAGNARIVIVSSSGHMLSPVIFDDLHFDFRTYDPWLAYGQSKTASILLAAALTKHWGKDGITANALNPGAIATNLQRHVGGKLVTPPERQKTVAQGAATSVLLAASPLLEGVSGRYFEDCNEAVTVSHRQPDFHGVAPYALHPANAERLWALSMQLIAGWEF